MQACGTFRVFRIHAAWKKPENARETRDRHARRTPASTPGRPSSRGADAHHPRSTRLKSTQRPHHGEPRIERRRASKTSRGTYNGARGGGTVVPRRPSVRERRNRTPPPGRGGGIERRAVRDFGALVAGRSAAAVRIRNDARETRRQRDSAGRRNVPGDGQVRTGRGVSAAGFPRGGRRRRRRAKQRVPAIPPPPTRPSPGPGSAVRRASCAGRGCAGRPPSPPPRRPPPDADRARNR